MSQVGVDIPLHSFLDFGIYGILLDLYLFQILLYLILHLCIHLDLLMECCTMVHYYIVWGYIVLVWYCTAVP